MPGLKPVSRVTLSEQVASQIAEQIAHGRWQPGDRLPSETELCATLKIGRSTLREALKSLAFVGLVQMRPGEGTYVLDGTERLVETSRPFVASCFETLLFLTLMTSLTFNACDGMLALRPFTVMWP